MRLVLYQPDIPQNTGAMMRLCACLGVGMTIIEPCGFSLDDKRMRRVTMDYGTHLQLERLPDWESFALQLNQQPNRPRIILLTTKAAQPYTDFTFHADDALLVGRESAGVPNTIHAAADSRVRIPMTGAARSLNVAISAAMVVGEALRQTRYSSV